MYRKCDSHRSAPNDGDSFPQNVGYPGTLTALYGSAAFKKRRRCMSASGIWFAVLFVRCRDGERTRIACTSHIGGLFVKRRPPDATTSTVSSNAERSVPRWKVVLALGPVSKENVVNQVCRMWSRSQRGIINKVARGEAICIRYGIPGFVDWESLFVVTDHPIDRFRFTRNPCRWNSTEAQTNSDDDDGNVEPRDGYWWLELDGDDMNIARPDDPRCNNQSDLCSSRT
jgi:hypothetical protein